MLLFVLLFSIQPYAQDIPIIGDTTDLKNHSVKQIVILQHFGGGDETGGGLFRRIDSTYSEGTHAFDYAAWQGKQWVRMQYMGDEMGAFSDLSAVGTIDIDAVGTVSDHVIDFSNVTINHSGSSGPVMIRAGTYGSPVTSSDAGQSGMIRLYGRNTATTDDEASGYYDRGIFVNNQITGTKAAFPISGLVEIRDVGSSEGPTSAMGGQFITGLHTSTSKLDSTASTTDGMFGIWAKVVSKTGSVTDTTSRVASIWLDQQMANETIKGEYYGIFATNGGMQADAWIGFETGGNQGWEYMWYFDETAYDEAPISTMTPATQTNDADGSIIINLNGTDYYIPYFGIGAD